jgi:hypothetical protein
VLDHWIGPKQECLDVVTLDPNQFCVHQCSDGGCPWLSVKQRHLAKHGTFGKHSH